MWWWVLAYVLQVLAVIALAVRDACRPQRALVWVVISLMLPGIGLLAYILLAMPLPARKERPIKHVSADKNALVPWPSGLSRAFDDVLSGLSGHAAQPARITLLGSGISTFDALLCAISQAQHRIDMEYYIFRDDGIGQRVIDRLCRAAQRGVRIRFLRDGLGSHGLRRSALRRMAAAGIECRVFAPPAFPRMLPLLTHRDHCKIVTIDERKAFVGGINVGNEYTGADPKTGPWRDTHLLFEGEAAVAQAQQVFETNFGSAKRDRKAHGDSPERRSPRLVHPGRARLAMETAAELTPEVDGVFPVPKPTKGLIHTIQSGPDSPMQRIRDAFFLAITMAQKSLCLTTPYFCPDVDLSMALRSAATRGVRVQLLVPKRPDHRLIGLASWTYFQPLVEAGVEVYLYTGGVLHAKVLTVDGEMAIVGAANCDMRSFRENYEVASVAYDWQLANQLDAQFARDLHQSQRLTIDDLQARSFGQHVAEQAARVLAAML